MNEQKIFLLCLDSVENVAANFLFSGFGNLGGLSKVGEELKSEDKRLRSNATRLDTLLLQDFLIDFLLTMITPTFSDLFCLSLHISHAQCDYTIGIELKPAIMRPFAVGRLPAFIPLLNCCVCCSHSRCSDNHSPHFTESYLAK